MRAASREVLRSVTPMWCGRWREKLAAREKREEKRFQKWMKLHPRPNSDPVWDGAPWTGQIEVGSPHPLTHCTTAITTTEPHGLRSAHQSQTVIPCVCVLGWGEGGGGEESVPEALLQLCRGRKAKV